MDEKVSFFHPVDPKTAGSGYGWRPDPFTGIKNFHYGIDYKVPTNTPVFASQSGTVSFVGNLSGYGKTIIVNHSNDFSTLYAHLDKFNVSINDQVGPDSLLGYSGSSGRSTGSHLHFEIRYKNKSLDPNKFLKLEKPIPQKSTFLIPALIAGFFLILQKK